MSWRGIDGAIAAAKQGHDTVLSPHPVLYLDNRQSQSPEEPTGRGHVSSLKDVYAFDPAPAQLTPDERKHILGVQANVWTEHMQTDTRMGADGLSHAPWPWPSAAGRRKRTRTGTTSPAGCRPRWRG